jgi:Uma2 family endonuclease
MATVAPKVPKLVAGDTLTREEFLRRWEAMPELKKAELIGGIVYLPDQVPLKGAVYMPSPVTAAHGKMENHVGVWLGVYAASTPGCEAMNNATAYMEADAPQPDVHLRLLPEAGGQSRVEDDFLHGAPELTTEVSLSRTSYDLHQKLKLYRTAGVKEYVAVLIEEQEVRWHRLVRGAYKRLRPSSEGVVRSAVFPGLWLHVPALLAGDMKQVLATLNQGLATPEHDAFAAKLARRLGR